ncbi:Mss4-like protein [Mycena maculata]|uniref:Mss4-like protein n=1 Tax=Mycena maculata TaxID=230809 RepID=A0AAD7IYP0_9AGAR|nr:Mss4-like protein [Mycena maculata]
MPGRSSKASSSDPRKMSPTEHKGACLCKGVQYTLAGEPQTVVICHCPDCAASGGSGFSVNAWYAKENVQVTAGADLLRTYEDIGRLTPDNTVLREFCSICGSNVFGTAPQRPESPVFVAVGTVIGDLGPEFTPKKEFYCLFRDKWMHPVDGASSDLSDIPFPLTKATWRETETTS